MIMKGALLLLVRSVSTALLSLAGGPWLLVYYGSDMGLYFAYKILRRDFWHWVPVVGAAGVVWSVVNRVVVKVIVDHTGAVQFRGAGEMGGCYFSFDMVRMRPIAPALTPVNTLTCVARSQIIALAASFVATRVYYASDPAQPVMEESRAWTIVGSLSAGWLTLFLSFLLLMKRNYVSTFFSTQSGHAWVQSYFVSGKTDEVKKSIFEFNKKQWASIQDDVKAWTLENWERWEEEKPEWFNDAWKSFLDDDMIPPTFLQKMGGAGSRRRSSLGGLMLGGASSRRRSSLVGGGGAEVHPVA